MTPDELREDVEKNKVRHYLKVGDEVQTDAGSLSWNGHVFGVTEENCNITFQGQVIYLAFDLVDSDECFGQPYILVEKGIE